MNRLIDADELMDRLKSEQATSDTTSDYDIGYWNGLTMAQSITRNAPTIDPDSLRPKGRWVNNHCSVCGETPFGEEMWTSFGVTPPRFEWCMDFCPCCGAKMIGDDDGTQPQS